MNSVVEKLAAIEKEVAAIQPKMVPLTQRIADLDHKVAGFAQQLAGIAEESAAVKNDIELTQHSLNRIQTLIGESKVESEQLVAGQEENLQRCETMTAVFGAAFQAVSQFFEAAQKMGLADQAKAVFLAPPPNIPIPQSPTPITEEPIAEEPITEEPIVEEPIVEEPIVEEPAVAGMDSVLTESDFDTVSSSMEFGESGSELPDVAAPPDLTESAMESGAEFADTESLSGIMPDDEPSDTMASQLDVPPLQLNPLHLDGASLPDLSVPMEMDEVNEQEIEDLLATMMVPVTASAGG